MKKSYKPTPRQILDWNINNELDGRSQPDVMEISLKFPKEISLDSIQKAYQTLIKRHKIFRTYFPIIKDEIVQEVNDFSSDTFFLLDLNSYSRDEIMNTREKTISKLKDIQSFPLVYGALWRQDTESIFIMLIHHILCDAWSKSIILEELKALCYHFHSKTPARLDSNVVQLCDYYERNKKLIDTTENDNLTYWKNKLSDKSWQVNFDKVYHSCLGSKSGLLKEKKFKGWQKLNSRDFFNNSSGEIYSIYMTGKLYEKLKRFCLETRFGMNSLLTASLNVLGMEMSGNENVLIRMVYHSRDNDTKLKIVGNLLGCLLLYSKIKKSDTFKNTILNYYDSFFKSVDNVIYNSEELEKLQVTARCFSSFNFIGMEMTNDGPTRIEDPQIEMTQGVWCPMHWNALEFSNTILFTCAYHSEIYDSDIITSMFNRYFELLEYMVTYPEKEFEHFVNTDMEMYLSL